MRVRVVFSQDFVHLSTLNCNVEDMLVPVLLTSLERIQLQLEFGVVFEVKEGEFSLAFDVKLEVKGELWMMPRQQTLMDR